VIREAIRKEGMVAIGKVVFTSREHNEDALKECFERSRRVSRSRGRSGASLPELLTSWTLCDGASRRALRRNQRKRKPANLPSGASPSRRKEEGQSEQVDYRESPPSITRSIGRDLVGGTIGSLTCKKAMVLLSSASIALGLMPAFAARRQW
jgi:hypothetical protein